MKLRIIILGIIGFALFTACTNTNNTNSSPQNPIDREEWMLARKAGTKNVEALRFAKKEIEKQLKNNSFPTKDGGIESWTEIGPNNIGGRVRAIVPSSNPNVIFVGTAGGGILKGTYNPTNKTMSWNILDDFLSSLAISCMAIDYSGSQDIIYAGTGEFFACRPSGCGGGQPGSGILRSIDGGNTWENIQLPVGYTNFWIAEIAVDHDNPGTLYVLSNQSDQNGLPNDTGIRGVIHKSINYGATWKSSLIFDGNGDALDYVCDIKIDPSDSYNILVSTWDGIKSGVAKVLRSTDGGYSYDVKQVSVGERIEFCFTPSAPDTVYMSESHSNFNLIQISRSWNSGKTWSFIGNFDFGGQATYNNALWVDPLDPSVIFAGGVNMYKSDNYGQSFNSISDWRDYHNGLDVDSDGNVANSLHGDQHVIVSAYDYSANNRRVWFGNDGGVANTEEIDAVSTNDKWNLLSMNNYSVTQFVGGDVSTNGTRFVGGAQDNSFSVGGTSGNWIQTTTGDGGYSLIDKSNFNTIYSTTQYGNLSKSTDGGISFCHIATFGNSCSWRDCIPSSTVCNGSEPFTSINDFPAFYMPLEMDPINSNTLYAGARSLWQSTDAGSSWSSKSPLRNSNGNALQIYSIDISRSNNNIVVVGHKLGRVYITDDISADSPVWTRLDNNTPYLPDSLITSVAINPFDEDVIMLSVAGYSQRSIWFTEDGGANWENRSLDFDMQVNTITWHPVNPHKVYIGTDIGIFASNNNGIDWSVDPLYSASGTEGPAYVEVSELTWQLNENRLVAFTHGRGVWLSNPIKNKLYVDKNYSGIEDGSITKPYNTFTEAVDTATPGTEIVFLSSATHDEINTSLLIDKKIKITLANGGNSVLIK